jgi:hypothetical protein
MILYDVTDRPDTVIERTTARYADGFGHGDLDLCDVTPIPHRFQQRVRKPEHQQVFYRFLTQIMVNAEDGRLVESTKHHVVETLRSRQVTPERFLQHHPGVGVELGVGESPDHGGCQIRRDSQVMHRPVHVQLGAAPRQRLKRRRVAVVPTDHDKPAGQRGQHCAVSVGHRRGYRGSGSTSQFLVIPVAGRDPDDRHVQQPTGSQLIQRRQQLAPTEVTRNPKKHEGIGAGSRRQPAHGDRARLER